MVQVSKKWAPPVPKKTTECQRQTAPSSTKCVNMNAIDVGDSTPGDGGAARFLDVEVPKTEAMHIVSNSKSGFKGIFMDSTPVGSEHLGATSKNYSGINFNLGHIVFYTKKDEPNPTKFIPRKVAEYNNLTGDYTGYFNHTINGSMTVGGIDIAKDLKEAKEDIKANKLLIEELTKQVEELTKKVDKLL